MADAALARREARRRRILENSHNRLQLISNITNDDCCKESPVKSVKTSIIEENSEIPAKKTESTLTRDIVNNGLTNNEPVSYDVLSNDNVEDGFFGDQVITNDLAGFAFPKPGPESTESTLLEKLSTYNFLHLTLTSGQSRSVWSWNLETKSPQLKTQATLTNFLTIVLPPDLLVAASNCVCSPLQDTATMVSCTAHPKV